MEILAEALMTNTFLEILNISESIIGDVGTQALGDRLASNTFV